MTDGLYYDTVTKAMVVCYGRNCYGKEVVLGNRVIRCNGLNYRENDVRNYPIEVMDRLVRIESHCWADGDYRFEWVEDKLGWGAGYKVRGGEWSPRWLEI